MALAELKQDPFTPPQPCFCPAWHCKGDIFEGFCIFHLAFLGLFQGGHESSGHRVWGPTAHITQGQFTIPLNGEEID